LNDREVEAFLAQATPKQRQEILWFLRHQYRFPLHPLELEWNTSAEAVLQAIYDAPDLTQRGVKGILAEATFRTVVVPERLAHWQSLPVQNDDAYDLLLDDGRGGVKVQVKNQRKEGGVPANFRMQRDVFVVETQRTRNGVRSDGEPSRPYRYGEFDVIAVCLQPLSGDWTDFIYCPQKRLLARQDRLDWLAVIQPVHLDGQNGWTRSFDIAATASRT